MSPKVLDLLIWRLEKVHNILPNGGLMVMNTMVDKFTFNKQNNLGASVSFESKHLGQYTN